MADAEKRPDKCWSSEFNVGSETSGLVVRFTRCSRYGNITDHTFGHTNKEKGLHVVKLEDTTAESRAKAVAILSERCMVLCQDCTLFHPIEDRDEEVDSSESTGSDDMFRSGAGAW